MTMPFDISLFVTVLGLIVVALSGLLYWSKDNLITLCHKGLINEMSKIYADTLAKAERYCHGANVTGRKLKIKRSLGKVRREYLVPKGILIISGLSAVGWLLCFSLAIVGFIMSGTGNQKMVNIALLIAQYCLLIMVVLAWFCRKTRVELPILFLLLCGLLWGIATFWAVVAGLLGWFLPIIPMEWISRIFILILGIPLIPVVIAVCNIVIYLFKEFSMYKTLKSAVSDFEKHRNDGNKKIKSIS